MSQFITGARALLLFTAIYGYCQHLRVRMNMNFVPAVFCCFIADSMVLAGILNVLKAAEVILLSAGLVFAFISIRKGEKPRELICPGTVFFLCAWLLYLVILYGTLFSHYDNFSHWGIVAEKILQINRFPNFMEKQITYQSYPLGSAAFIYFFAKALGSTKEWVLLWIQMGMTLSMASALFVFADSRMEKVLTGFAAMFLVGGNTAPDALLVDTLLPMITLAGMAMCMYGREHFSRMWPELLILNLCLVSVKNSGIFFAVLLLMIASWQNRNTLLREWKTWAVQWLSPPGWMYLWKKHVVLVFRYALGTKHAMSYAEYKIHFLKTDNETVRLITEKILKSFFSISNRFLYLFVFIIVTGIIGRNLKEHKKTDSVSGVILLSTVGYLIGLWGMYLFSMPLDEAVNLAGYDRYFRSILIFDAGTVFMQTMIECGERQKETKRIKSISAFLSLFAVFMAVNPTAKYYRRSPVEGMRIEMEQIISEYDVPKEKRYLLLVPEDRGYRSHLANYLLDSAEITAITEEKLSDAEVNWQDFDYVIDTRGSEITKRYLQEQFGRSDSVIQLEIQQGSGD